MKTFESKQFLARMQERTKERGIPSCPFCGSQKFSTTSTVAKILMSESVDGITIGPNIPAGTIVCANCGHIEFFAIGVLGMLESAEKGGENHVQ